MNAGTMSEKKPGRTNRLDIALVERELVASRAKAQALIMARRVTVNGEFVDKAGTKVKADDEIGIIEPEHPWVGRGGMKLAGAIESWGRPLVVSRM